MKAIIILVDRKVVNDISSGKEEGDAKELLSLGFPLNPIEKLQFVIQVPDKQEKEIVAHLARIDAVKEIYVKSDRAKKTVCWQESG